MASKSEGMGRHFVTFGDDANFRHQRRRLEREAQDTGWFDRVLALTEYHISGFL